MATSPLQAAPDPIQALQHAWRFRARSADPAVRYWAAGQAWMPLEAVRTLCGDRDPAVAARARKTVLEQQGVPNHAPAWPECYPYPVQQTIPIPPSKRVHSLGEVSGC